MQFNNVDSALVHPIQITTPFAVGDVYCYLITDEKIVLVDTGHFTDGALEKLNSELRKQGIDVRDIDEIWLTHGHPDHYGQAGRLAELSGAKVFGHSQERANFAGNEDRVFFRDFFARHHIPEKYTKLMLEQLDWLQQYQQPIEPEWIEEGEELRSGMLSAKVHHTPGHAPGHLTFASDRGFIFSGDLLLGHISTNALINFDPESGRRNKSLLQYRESLKWIREQEGIVLPGHGKRIEHIKEVADHHLDEHEKRYRQIQQLLESHPMTLLELAQQMFPDAIREGAIFLVLSEVLGYLDWGIEEEVIQIDEKKMKYYRVSE